MHGVARTDPMNPRWQTSEERRRRSATSWKLIVGVAAGSALTTVIVVSCLDQQKARRANDEPSSVETTGAATRGARTDAGSVRPRKAAIGASGVGTAEAGAGPFR